MRSCVVAASMAAAAVPQPGAPSVQDRRPHPHDSKDRLRRAILPGALCGSLSEVYRMQSSGVLQQRGPRRPDSTSAAARATADLRCRLAEREELFIKAALPSICLQFNSE